MNKNKIKRIYKKIANRYHQCHFYPWESITNYMDKLDTKVYWNIPYIRHKNGYKKLLQMYEICKEFGVKGISKETIAKYDPWNDDKISSYRDRKSWKRNSKRPHQWKDK